VTAPPASAATPDTTPPQLSLVKFPAFRPGGQIGPSSSAFPLTDKIPIHIAWSGSDASGICGYDVKGLDGVGRVTPLVTGTMRTRYDSTTSDFGWSDFAVNSAFVVWRVVAHDCAGNTTRREVWVTPTVEQEDGQRVGNRDATITYTGTWGKSMCACWSRGAVQRTSQQGATASISYSLASYEAGAPVALVMEKAPDRGKFTLRIDGISRGTIDTSAPSATHRIIVWTGSIPGAGSHVIKLVNQATPGRPRIDFDAVLLF